MAARGGGAGSLSPLAARATNTGRTGTVGGSSSAARPAERLRTRGGEDTAATSAGAVAVDALRCPRVTSCCARPRVSATGQLSMPGQCTHKLRRVERPGRSIGVRDKHKGAGAFTRGLLLPRGQHVLRIVRARRSVTRPAAARQQRRAAPPPPPRAPAPGGRSGGRTCANLSAARCARPPTQLGPAVRTPRKSHRLPLCGTIGGGDSALAATHARERRGQCSRASHGAATRTPSHSACIARGAQKAVRSLAVFRTAATRRWGEDARRMRDCARLCSQRHEKSLSGRSSTSSDCHWGVCQQGVRATAAARKSVLCRVNVWRKRIQPINVARRRKRSGGGRPGPPAPAGELLCPPNTPR